MCYTNETAVQFPAIVQYQQNDSLIDPQGS